MISFIFFKWLALQLKTHHLVHNRGDDLLTAGNYFQQKINAISLDELFLGDVSGESVLYIGKLLVPLGWRAP